MLRVAGMTIGFFFFLLLLQSVFETGLVINTYWEVCVVKPLPSKTLFIRSNNRLPMQIRKEAKLCVKYWSAALTSTEQ